jgi:hypothetical protein
MKTPQEAAREYANQCLLIIEDLTENNPVEHGKE